MAEPTNRLSIHPVYDAIVRSGFKMPDNVIGVTVDEVRDNVTQLNIRCYLTEQQLAAFGAALSDTTKEQK